MKDNKAREQGKSRVSLLLQVQQASLTNGLSPSLGLPGRRWDLDTPTNTSHGFVMFRVFTSSVCLRRLSRDYAVHFHGAVNQQCVRRSYHHGVIGVAVEFSLLNFFGNQWSKCSRSRVLAQQPPCRSRRTSYVKKMANRFHMLPLTH